MVKERNYLIETLKSSGIKSQVYTNMKKLKAGNEVHVGAVLRNGETFARSGSKKTYIDQEGQRKRRVKLWDRSTSLHVVIADTSEEKVEEILENFLQNLKKGIDVNGNWVNIVVGEADWVEEGDSILKAKVAVQFDITFEGGIYQDRDIKPMVALQEWVHHLNQCQQQGVMSFIENKFIIRGLELNEKFANWKNFFSRLGTDIFFCYRENIILKTLKLPMSKGNE